MKRIILLAGPGNHGPGAHEYFAGCKLLEAALKEALPQLDVSTMLADTSASRTKDPQLFDGVDAVFVSGSGGGDNPIRWYWDPLVALCERGGGLACFHYAIDIITGAEGDRLKRWIGGFYEDGYSINPTWTAATQPHPNHPITRGVKPFTLEDEWYYTIRFPEDRRGWTSVLEAVPDDDARSGRTSWPHEPKEHVIKASGQSETLMWCLERADGGRGFGFTGGHNHSLWTHDDFRKIVLNGIVWLAKETVPAEGIPSLRPTEADLSKNLWQTPAGN